MYLLVAYSLTWSFGGNLIEESKIKLSNHLRTEIMRNSGKLFRECMSIFDFYYDFSEMKLKFWKDRIKEYVYNPMIPYFNIIVPTLESIQTNSILNDLLRN